MNLKSENIFFLGIGGIGMSALARYYKHLGKNVYGYDKTPSNLTVELENEGITVFYSDDTSLVKQKPDLVVFTPAVPKDSELYKYCEREKLVIMKRSEVLGLISQDYFTIAVAGTHGKTTTTSLITHILKYNNSPVIAFVGGICKNYNSNLILTENAKYLVVEADEFDRSFLTLHPDIAIINSMDADHLDIYGHHDSLKESFFLFTKNIKKGGQLFIKQGLPTTVLMDVNIQYFSSSKNSDIKAGESEINNGRQIFNIETNEGDSILVNTFLPGKHNVENIAAAVATCKLVGLTNNQISDALKSYTGVERRYDLRYEGKNGVYIDDYAHHPAEISATLTAVRTMFPGKKITAIFQPHLFTRTRDFATEFAQSLAICDNLLLMPIYPARENPIVGVDSQMLINLTNLKNKEIIEKENLIARIEAIKPELLITLGAGDIDRFVEPLTHVYENL